MFMYNNYMGERILALKIPGPEGGQTKDLTPPEGLLEGLKTGADQNPVLQLSQLGYNIFFLAALIIGVAVIMLSGIQIITSGGDSEKIKSAKSRLMYAIIGLVILLGAFFILNVLSSILGVKPQNVK